jgi:5-(carboxyamino)imidazole ribonucleotide synthase
LASLQAALDEFGFPAVLKSAGFGYDGKGQYTINRPDELQKAWEAVSEREAVLEAFIDFERELSVVAARCDNGQFVHYGVVENRHRNHILDLTIAPASVPPSVEQDAVEIARTILEKLDVVGVLCVEFFLRKNGTLLVNELAPRPHNSGHFTFDASVTSQFEQQLRAVCGLPLGSVEQLSPAAMANLLGDLWEPREPDWSAAANVPNVKLHLYGKLSARPGRKMGHLTALARNTQQAYQDVERSRHLLTGDGRCDG